MTARVVALLAALLAAAALGAGLHRVWASVADEHPATIEQLCRRLLLEQHSEWDSVGIGNTWGECLDVMPRTYQPTVRIRK